MKQKKTASQPDNVLLIAFVLLVFIGLVMVYSASVFYAENARNDQFYYFKRQFVAFVLGLVAVMVFSSIRLTALKKIAPVALIAALVLAAYQGVVVRSRWFVLGPVHFQTVDVVRFVLTIYLPYYIVRAQEDLKSFSEGLLPALIIIASLAGLTILQKDFSSGMALFLLGMTILAVSPARFSHLLGFGVSSLVVALGGIAISGYNMSRILVFLNPHEKPLEEGWQVIHSLTSLGRGGITGVGFAQSREKMFYLPEAHTDFIFSIIGEEWGIVGTLLIVTLFFTILVRGVRIARRQRDPYSYYLTVGILANFMWYSIMNMMIALKLLPPTGLPLPFISYGGTALLINMALAGLLLNLSRDAEVLETDPIPVTGKEQRVFYYTRKKQWRKNR